MKILNFLFLTFILLGCSNDGNDFPKIVPYPEEDIAPEPEKPDPETIEKYTVFNSGDDGINSYRIPSICTTKNGTLLSFAEARRDTWKDRSFTNIVCKRSTDNGKTWSELKYLTDLEQGSKSAYINPCPVVDMETGNIFVFFVYWQTGTDNNGRGNKGYMVKSTDDGVTWTEPTDITEEILTSSRHPSTPDNEYQYIYSFGPGSGLQMKGGEYPGRLIIPCGQSFINSSGKRKASNVTVYSDDHGVTWKSGNISYWFAEYQIAESPEGVLVTNLRSSRKVNGKSEGIRGSSVSRDYGITWSDWDPTGSLIYYEELKTPKGGCQGSILGEGEYIYYSGPEGITSTDKHDDRGKLTIYKGITDMFGETTWGNGILLYDKASGYSCITRLQDGRLAILFEAGDDIAFLKQDPRPAGWMHLDLIIIPKI